MTNDPLLSRHYHLIGSQFKMYQRRGSLMEVFYINSAFNGHEIWVRENRFELQIGRGTLLKENVFSRYFHGNVSQHNLHKRIEKFLSASGCEML